MLAAIGNKLKDYWVNFIRVAAGKPRLDSIPREVGVLIVFLCLLSLDVGDWIGQIGLGHPRGAGLNVLVAAMLVLNWLAFQFRWPRGLTIFLRIGVFVLMGCVFVVLFLGA